MTKSHARRFVSSAWTLLSFQFIASVGAVAVTGAAALHVSRIAAQLEAQQPATEPEAAIEEAGVDPSAPTEEGPPERAPQDETPVTPTPTDGVSVSVDESRPQPQQTQPERPTQIAACGRTVVDRAPTFARAPTNTVVFRVPANAEWCDTGVGLQQGQTLVLRAQGRWGHAADNVYGPAGTRERSRAVLFPQAPVGMLIARVGERIFPVGEGQQVAVPGNGTLQLSINDVSGGFSDNSGVVEVQIQITQTPAPG